MAAPSRIELVQNDTAPQLLLTIGDDQTGLPLNLSTATELRMHFGVLGGALKATIPLVPGPDAAAGQCLLDWPEGVLDTEGIFEGEVQILWSTGRVQTTPKKLRFRVRKEMA